MILKHIANEKEKEAIREKMGINKIPSEASLFFLGLDYFNCFRNKPFEKKENYLLMMKDPKSFGLNWLAFYDDSFKYGMGGLGKNNKSINVSFADAGSEAFLYQFVPWVGYSNTKFSIGIGTCGGIKKGLKVGDIIICTHSLGEWEGAKHRLGRKRELKTNKKIIRALEDSCKKLKVKYTKGKIFSVSDVFLEDEIIHELKIKQKGFIGVEHENYTANVISENYNKPFCSIMLISDLPINGENYYLSQRSSSGKDKLSENLSLIFKIAALATASLLDDNQD